MASKALDGSPGVSFCFDDRLRRILVLLSTQPAHWAFYFWVCLPAAPGRFSTNKGPLYLVRLWWKRMPSICEVEHIPLLMLSSSYLSRDMVLFNPSK